MNNQVVTYNAVAYVADAQSQKGLKPSIQSISNELKAFEQDAEISQHLESWYRQHPDYQRSSPEISDEELFERIPDDAVQQKLFKKTQELKTALSLSRATLESTADGILIINKSGEVTDWNQKFVDMWRLPVGLLEAGPEGPGFAYVLDQVEEPEVLVQQVTKMYDNPDEQGTLGEVKFNDGRVFQRYSQPHRLDKEIIGRVWSFRDITKERQNENKLKLRQCAIEASPNGVFIIEVSDDNNKIVYVNPSFERITGYEPDTILGKNFGLLFGNKKQTHQCHRINKAIVDGVDISVEMLCKSFEGKTFDAEISFAPVRDTDYKDNVYVGLINDISQRKKMEKQLIYQASYDSLTNLPNRSLLIDRLNQEILRAKEKQYEIAILFLDLDRFKDINDTVGHTLGDKLLQMVANRLVKLSRKMDTVSRIGGDEFVILMPDVHHNIDALNTGKKILFELDQPFYIEGQEFNITSSIGASFYPKDGDNFETLMKNADLSMYSAKDSGRNNIKVFNEEMQDQINRRVSMESELRNALVNKEFSLAFQPIVDARTEKYLGAEALLRWNNKKFGMVSPVEFIPALEDTGLIIPVGKWVLENAIDNLMKIHEMGHEDFRVSVNLSSIQFSRNTVLDNVTELLEITKLAPKTLDLEITESLVLDNLDKTVDVLNALKTLGVSISIDDFGTGYSSLSYLKQLPVDKLKVDRSFVKDITTNNGNASITKAIIQLAHAIDLKVVAEGVETKGQLSLLKAMQCDYIQGYYYSKPTTLEELVKQIQNQ